jgi:hypothetical protein
MIDGRPQRTKLFALFAHRLQYLVVALVHDDAWAGFFIRQDMGHLMHPAIGELDPGPVVSALREGFGEDAPQLC